MPIIIDDIKVMLITDEKRNCGRSTVEIVAAAVRGGIRCVQYRPWKATDADFLETACRLREITEAAGAMLIINDRTDIAALARADGVHLGAGDIPIAQAYRLLGNDATVGYSAHEKDEAYAAAKAGAAYITYSPIFATTSSSNPRPVKSVDELVRVSMNLPIPAFALGGIREDNAQQLIEQGIDQVAVVSAITEAEDIEAAARKLCTIFGQ